MDMASKINTDYQGEDVILLEKVTVIGYCLLTSFAPTPFQFIKGL